MSEEAADGEVAFYVCDSTDEPVVVFLGVLDWPSDMNALCTVPT